MANLDATRSVSYLSAIANNVPQLGNPGVGLADRAPLAPAPPREAPSTNIAALPGKRMNVLLLKWQRLKGYVVALPDRCPWTVLLLKCGLFYADFISDVLYAILLRDNPELVGPSNVVISVLVLPPVALSAMDLFEYCKVDEGVWVEREGTKGISTPNYQPNLHWAAQMGWKGVLLNFTNTRML